MPISDFDARNFLVVLLASVVGAAACAPSGDLGQYTDTDAAEDTTEGPGESSGPAPTSAADPEQPETVTGVSCEEESDVGVGWSVVGFEPDITEQDFAATCTVTVVQPAPATIFLDCGEREVRIGFGDATLAPIAVGDSLAFDYRRQNLSHFQNWFTLRRLVPDATLFAAGIHAGSLAPPNAPDFFAPLHMTPGAGVCPTTPTCDSPFEKIAVEFAHEGHAVALLPPSAMLFGDAARYRLGVGEARDNHVELTDVPTGSCDLSNFEPHNYTVHLILAE